MNLRLIIAGLILAITSTIALAAGFEPTKKTIEIIVPYPAGGATDKIGRTVSDILNQHGWKSVVINKPGADTVIGSNFVAASAPNGHTLYIGGNGFIDANIAFKNKAPGIEYTENSFAPVAPLGVGTLVLSVPANSPINTYEEYKAWIRKNPEQFNIGFWNTYTANIFYEWARLEKLPRPQIISYKGSAPLVLDLVGGNIQASFDTFTAIRPHYEAGKVKILATLDADGAKVVSQSGPGTKPVVISSRHPIMNIPIWYGLFAPSGTDPEVIKEINTVVNQGLSDPTLLETFKTFSIVNVGGTPQDLDRRQKSILKSMKTISKNIE